MDLTLNQVVNHAPLFCAFGPCKAVIYYLAREIELFEASAGSHF
jgi:hypothetical protein